jgi:protease-4
MGSVAASGAYYIACGAKKVFANPGTITGSIGVIMEFANLEKLYDWAKVQRYSIKTGAFKDAGADYRGMTPEERQLLQRMVDDVLVQFKTAVQEGRKLTAEQVTALADGRIFSGAQAKAAKMVDELGGIQDAILEAGKLAGIKDKPRVLFPEPKRSRMLDLLLDSDRGEDEEAESALSGSLLRQWVFRELGVKAPQGLPAGIYWLWNLGR